MEGQYLIFLWTAHMIVEYGHPGNELMTTAIKTIISYSDNPLRPDVAEEEREWLKSNLGKYKEYI
jgi:hypothetical protein